ncbi:hypothetical protein NE237_011851 [Protea cynaroides]|uniref:Uncharacterized protein n=1 Tax=Protea cynaroides TaxID=273540 RepID=A0A9Q0JYQ5_9MAGN|nr:hypothetical protein NE237_011851 [Protea cynaroides]
MIASVIRHFDYCFINTTHKSNGFINSYSVIQYAFQGLAINIPYEDHLMQSLKEIKQIGIQCADHARKVASDSRALGLDEVFKLSTDVPIHFEKELKLLRA